MINDEVDPRVVKLYSTEVFERVLKNLVLGENGCIEWTGNLEEGYGRISIGPRDDRMRIYVHRWALQLAMCGTILPPEIFACHKCDNPKCVNPHHLFPGTTQDNTADMVQKGRSVVSFGNAKLNWEIVDDIRSSSLTGKELVVKHGVSKATISEVRNNIIWKEEHRGIALIHSDIKK
jgi:hypothetical protein